MAQSFDVITVVAFIIAVVCFFSFCAWTRSSEEEPRAQRARKKSPRRRYCEWKKDTIVTLLSINCNLYRKSSSLTCKIINNYTYNRYVLNSNYAVIKYSLNKGPVVNVIYCFIWTFIKKPRKKDKKKSEDGLCFLLPSLRRHTHTHIIIHCISSWYKQQQKQKERKHSPKFTFN